MLSRKAVKLVLVSFAILFIEIALIRWISTESRIFAYVNNLVLLACFLGLGYGSYSAKRKPALYLSSLSLASLILLFTLPLKITGGGEQLHIFRDIPIFLSSFTDSIVWFEPEGASGIFMPILGIAATLIIFALVFVSFVPLGRIIGRIFDNTGRTIWAYSINVVFSIIGIWVFSAMSFFYISPVVWFVLIIFLIAGMIMVEKKKGTIDIAAAAVLLLALGPMLFSPGQDDSDTRVTLWSPYQKLSLDRFIDPSSGLNRGYFIDVNNTGYMTLLDLSNRQVKKYPQYFDLESRKYSQYDIPYRFALAKEQVLILGAGAGNDAAGALRNEAGHVDAVEIDPGIYKLGRKYHPERPYSDSRVNVIIDDARSYLKQTDRKYDLISVGLLDAHTHSSSYNNTRLDHYVYTRESFAEMKDRLGENGILTVIFEAQRPWIARRINDNLSEVFGKAPLAFELRTRGWYGWGGAMFICEKTPGTIDTAFANDPYLKLYVSGRQIDFTRRQYRTAVPVTTDDWPYLYLKSASIPLMHLTIMILLGLVALFAGGKMIRTQGKFNLNFFFLGAGFLLLEFQNVSKATLLFGSTWLVNSLIFSAILILILGANYYAHRVRIKSLGPYYALLIAVVILNYIVPLNIYNALGLAPRLIVSLAVMNLPVFFAGIIFIDTFRKTERKDLAFGSNLIGAAFGGLAESLSFVFGIKALLLIVGVFYLMSFIAARGTLRVPAITEKKKLVWLFGPSIFKGRYLESGSPDSGGSPGSASSRSSSR